MIAASPSPNPAVTWIQVEKPTFDLAGVLLSSLTLAALLVVFAFALGFGLGVFFIRRARQQAALDAESIRLHLDES